MGVTYILPLRPSERIIIDTARLDEIFKTLGAYDAEMKLIEAVEQISDTLAEVDGLIRQPTLDGVADRARRVSRLSLDIGLTSLARVSRDLAISAGRGDLVAFRAVWERLVRIGDRSLTQLWELPGLSL